MTASSTDARPELAALEESAAGVVAAGRTARVRPGEWTPALVLAHLSQVDEAVWLPRVDQMVDARHAGAASPSFTWWESAPGSTEAAFGMLDLDASTALFLDSRKRLVDRLAALDDDEWLAIAHHDVFGVIDVVGLVREVLAHDSEHLQALTT